MTTAQIESQRARTRLRSLNKARKAREQMRRSNVWAQVKTAQKMYECTCPLKAGMTADQLRPMGAGCKASVNGKPGWVCEALDKYRRLIGC